MFRVSFQKTPLVKRESPSLSCVLLPATLFLLSNIVSRYANEATDVSIIITMTLFKREASRRLSPAFLANSLTFMRN